MIAEILELGQRHAEHKIYRHPENGELRVQGKPLINWVFEVARDCVHIDEVRVVCGQAVAVFDIDRSYDPARVTITNFLDKRKTA
jgi:GTP:adenosylcobinamide-phosphate guanylyltransferase